MVRKAVADYRPASAADQKMKKDTANEDGLTLTLVRNPDILATLAEHSQRPDCCVGFAVRAADDLDHLIHRVEDGLEAFKGVYPQAHRFQLVFEAVGDNIESEM